MNIELLNLDNIRSARKSFKKDLHLKILNSYFCYFTDCIFPFYFASNNIKIDIQESFSELPNEFLKELWEILIKNMRRDDIIEFFEFYGTCMKWADKKKTSDLTHDTF